ncbi:MAG: pitrilysin family protein [Steroidobacteraceae bacterium]
MPASRKPFRPSLLPLVAACAAALAPGASRAAGPVTATPPAPAAAAVRAVQVPAFRRIVLPNGLVLVLMPIREVPLTAFSVIVRSGARADAPAKAGTAALLAALLEKGAGGRDAFAFADAVAGAGGSFNAAAGPEAITLGGQFLSRDRELMVGLIADVLLRPRLEAAEFDKLRTRAIEEIKAAKDSDPSGLVGTYGRALLFGTHPYATPVDGSEHSLAGVTHDDVSGYWRREFGADRTTIVFAGDIDERWLEAAARRAFGGLARAAAPAAALPEAPPLHGRRVLLVDAPGSVQAYFWLGNVGVARRYPQRAALDVLNTLYGGRFTSILNTELRIKTGLSYSASSGFVRGSVPGEFAIRSFTQTENTARALDLALATLAKLHADGVDAVQLDSARAYVLGQYPLRLETAAHWAGTMAELEFFGQDRSYIEGYGPALAAVGLDDARAVIADAFPSPDDLAIVLIGDAAKIRDVARRYGPVTETQLAAEDYLPASVPAPAPTR